MRHHFLFSLCIILFTTCISLVFWYFSPFNAMQNFSYAAPLPDFLNLGKNQQVRFLDLWLPTLQTSQAHAAENTDYTAKSILMYDLTTNQTLFAKDPTVRTPMASLTKIMTTIIALENKKSDDRYIVPSEAIVGEDSMGLTAGETLSLNELLYGIFLHSANDAAETIAWNYSGGRSAFINAMNQKAQSLGLTDTNFTNPTGLQGDGDQHTTAYDLLVISKDLLQEDPNITDITSQYTYTIPQTATHKEFDLSNETNLISTYPGVIGLKDGYTDEAGLCLISLLKYDGHEILGIVLDSQDRRNEMKRLLDYSLQTEGIQPPIVSD